MRSSSRNFIAIALLLALAGAFCKSVRAVPSQMDGGPQADPNENSSQSRERPGVQSLQYPNELHDLASLARHEFQNNGVANVLVMNFHSPGVPVGESNEFLDWLTAGFAKDLEGGKDGPKVKRESEVGTIHTVTGPQPDTSGVNGMVIGTLSRFGDTIRVVVRLVRCPAGADGASRTEATTTLSAAIPLREGYAAWLPQPPPRGPISIAGSPGVWSPVSPGEGSIVPRPLGQPACRSCPDPEYSKEARKKKISGTVLLSVTVGPDGGVAHAKIVRGLGYGLDEKAIEAVMQWQFWPAEDSEGNAITARINVEVAFRLR